MSKRQPKTVPQWTYDEMIDWCEAYVLKEFINRGGVGLHNSIITVLNIAEQWFGAQKKEGK